ncbi:MAG: response regulator transcription factor [Candidatus Riflebacteria bacterium]|nr:response regulator transcription factor [Candidatus Riflebacteria bacterium]
MIKQEQVIRVFLLEDHPVMRLGLKKMLEECGFEISGEAENPQQALILLQTAKTDVAIFDLSLQGETAFSAIAECRKRYPKLPIIIYSMHDSPLIVDNALHAGANGYVTKADSVETLISAIEEVLKGKRHIGPSLVKELQKQTVELEKQGFDFKKISRREIEVLTLIGQGYGLSEIAERLSISAKTVETHQIRLREKLGVKTNRELTRAAIKFLQPG